MDGPPVRIMVDPNASPVTIQTPISVPLHWQEQVKADMDRDIALGVIEHVPVGEPMTWCSMMVITRKKSGGPRRCVYYQALNKLCTRETHHTMSQFHQATLFPEDMKNTVTDAWNGYHSVPTSTRKTVTTPHSSRHGADTVSRPCPRGSSLLEMATLDDMTKSLPTSHTKLSALTTSACGPRQ